MSGKEIHSATEGFWDDDEWISWDSIDYNLYGSDKRKEYPYASFEIIEIFEDLVDSARAYKNATGRYLQIWGELGEFYAEIKFGLERHSPGTQGSDGRIGNDWVEVKTISPEKDKQAIIVKRSGNFNKLLIVRINEEFEFEGKLFDRKKIKKGKGKFARFSWKSRKSD